MNLNVDQSVELSRARRIVFFNIVSREESSPSNAYNMQRMMVYKKETEPFVKPELEIRPRKVGRDMESIIDRIKTEIRDEYACSGTKKLKSISAYGAAPIVIDISGMTNQQDAKKLRHYEWKNGVFFIE